MIILSCDHAGIEFLKEIETYLKRKNLEYKYMGPSKLVPDDDYPDYILPACTEVLKDKNNFGIFVCGSGVGVAMCANRVKGIRAVNAYRAEVAEFARKHNNANVITFGTRYISPFYAKLILNSFLWTEFEGGRHLRRINKF